MSEPRKKKEVGPLIAIRTYVNLEEPGVKHLIAPSSIPCQMSELSALRDACDGEELRVLGQQACDALTSMTDTDYSLKPEKK
jgi:hypothetical protein